MLSRASLSLVQTETEERENIPVALSSPSTTSPEEDDESRSLSELKQTCQKRKTMATKNVRDSVNEGTGSEHRHLMSFSPGRWSRGRQQPVGNLTSTFEALMAVLKYLPEQSATFPSCQEESEPTASQLLKNDEINYLISLVSQCLRQLLLEKIQRPGCLLTLLERNGDSIMHLVDWCERLPPRTLKPSIRQRIESLPTDLLDHVKSICPGPYDSKLLTHLAPIITGICTVQPATRAMALTPSQRKAKRALIVPFASFWNSTFAESHQLEYSEDLLSCLKNAKHRYRLPIYLPANAVTIPSATPRLPEEEVGRIFPQRQDSQVNSECYSTPPSSPTKAIPLVGSFLHRQSPMLANVPSPMEMDKSPGEDAGPILGGKPTVLSRVVRSPAAHLPPPKASVDDDANSQDFVFVPTASVRLTRLRLTEHQKERMTELRRSEYVPAMYNGLDNSQPSQVPYFRSGSVDSGSQISQMSQADSTQQPQSRNETESSQSPPPLADRIRLRSLLEETAEKVTKENGLVDDRAADTETEKTTELDDSNETGDKESQDGDDVLVAVEAKVAKPVGRPFLVVDEKEFSSGTSSSRLILEDAEFRKEESESSKVASRPPFLVNGLPDNKSESTPNISTVAVISSPVITSPGGGSDLDDEKETQEMPAEPPAGCSTPLSGEKKLQKPLRLGISGLAARLQPKAQRSAPSKLSLSLPDADLSLASRVKRQRSMAIMRSNNTSRGAKMVALAQASQAERREKARLERENNGSIGSDSSFTSQRSSTSPPGIIRSFFTPSKGHRVSFAEPLTSTWDGASPRASSVSLCVEVGTPKNESMIDCESCRKSLVDEFETANNSWDEPPANDLDESGGDIIVESKVQDEEEEEEDTQNVTVAMVGGEGVNVEEFHSSEKEETDEPTLAGLEKSSSNVEVILIEDDNGNISQTVSEKDSAIVPEDEDSDDDIEIEETQDVDDKLNESGSEGDDGPPPKRRRVRVENEKSIETSDDDIEVKGTQELDVNKEEEKSQNEQKDGDKEGPDETEASRSMVESKNKEKNQLSEPTEDYEEEEESQPIQISLHAFTDSQQPEEDEERPTAVRMYLGAPEDSETLSGTPFDEINEEMARIEERLELVTSKERMKVAGEMAKLLQMCLNKNN